MNIKKMVLLTIAIVVIVTPLTGKLNRKYEYIDFGNKRDISKKCYINDDGLFCIKNKKKISVKQYGLK